MKIKNTQILMYALIGALTMGISIYIILFIGMYVIHGRVFTGLDEP
ncbi:hypothetical protein [Muribaculum sp.]|nr:hypothetical protein [Muribaculum sp.]MDE5705226.1 hypothetical protein [Muribaculum sp.]